MTTWTLTCYDGRTYPCPPLWPGGWSTGWGPLRQLLGEDPVDGGGGGHLGRPYRLQVTQGGETLFMGGGGRVRDLLGAGGVYGHLLRPGDAGPAAGQPGRGGGLRPGHLGGHPGPVCEPLQDYPGPGGELAGGAGVLRGLGAGCWKVVYDFARYHGGGDAAVHPGGEAGPPPLGGRGAPGAGRRGPGDPGGPAGPAVRGAVPGDGEGRVRLDPADGGEQKPSGPVGGQCSQVLLLPRKTGYQARRYQAQFQLDRSASQLRTAEVTVALPFAAWPGDLVDLEGWGGGRWRVRESKVSLGGGGL